MDEQLSRRALPKRLASRLSDAILQGELKPGDRIVEAKVARQLGLAQGTLREALRELEHQGLVTKHGHGGTFVSKLTISEINDIYLVRRELEPLAAMLWHQRSKPEEFVQLSKIFADMEIAGKDRDFARLVKADFDFHKLIWRLSGNDAIEKALNAVCPPLFASYLIKASTCDPYEVSNDLEIHRTLVNALRQGTTKGIRNTFKKTMDLFRADDIQNLRNLEANRESSSGKPSGDSDFGIAGQVSS